MKRILLLFGLFASLACQSAEYIAPPSGPSSKLRAWSLLETNAKQDALGATSAIIGSNATLNGVLKLQGHTNQIGDNGSALTYNGSAVGGGDSIWTGTSANASVADQAIDHDVQINSTNGGTIQLATSDANAEIFLYGGFASNWELDAYAYDQASALRIHNNGESFSIIDPAQDNGLSPYVFGAVADIAANSAHTVWKDATNSATLATLYGDGKLQTAGGFASTDTTAAVNIAATGWTNTFGKNAVVYYDGISVTATVFNNAGTAIYTNATALGGGSILLQPSGKVILSGTSVVGRAAPF